MQATVAAWLMATLTPSAFMVALVQTASTAPSMLFGLFAGALADIVDRRRIIIVSQVMLAATSVLLGLATVSGIIGPSGLLMLTFVIGAGFAFYQPAQGASVNEMVSRAEPALAGALAAWIGTGSALLASSVFFVPMILAALRWQVRAIMLPGTPETLLS